jgi:hypothetical protein
MRIGVECSGVEWSGVEWSGLDWIGVDWSGLDWRGLEWSGVERIALHCMVGHTSIALTSEIQVVGCKFRMKIKHESRQGVVQMLGRCGNVSNVLISCCHFCQTYSSAMQCINAMHNHCALQVMVIEAYQFRLADRCTTCWLLYSTTMHWIQARTLHHCVVQARR